jgi:hypothetical protein
MRGCLRRDRNERVGIKGRGRLLFLKPEGEFIIYCRG